MENKPIPIVIRIEAKNHNRILIHENTNIKSAYNKFDGYKLSQISMQVELNCKADFEDLIKLLEIHKHCFIDPEIINL